MEMKNRLCFLLLVLVLIIMPAVVVGQSDSKKFVPGVNIIEVGELFFNHPLHIEKWSGPEYHTVELVDNFGPNGEEALKIQLLKDSKNSLILSHSFFNVPFGLCEFSVEYKADLKTTKEGDYKSYILVSADIPYKEGSNLIVIGGRCYVPIILENSKDWKKRSVVTFYNNQYIAPTVIFMFGGLNDSVSVTGSFYFINMELVKKERPGD